MAQLSKPSRSLRTEETEHLFTFPRRESFALQRAVLKLAFTRTLFAQSAVT